MKIQLRDHADNPLLQRVSDIRATSEIHVSKMHVLQMNMTVLFRYFQIREVADEVILHDLDVFFE